MVHAAVEKKLAIVTGVREIAISRQDKRRQIRRQKRGAVLSCVIRRYKEEGAVLDDWTTNRGGILLQRVRNVYRIDRAER